MVNTKEFTNRLQEIIEYYDLTASSFANKAAAPGIGEAAPTAICLSLTSKSAN